MFATKCESMHHILFCQGLNSFSFLAEMSSWSVSATILSARSWRVHLIGTRNRNQGRLFRSAELTVGARPNDQNHCRLLADCFM